MLLRRGAARAGADGEGAQLEGLPEQMAWAVVCEGRGFQQRQGASWRTSKGAATLAGASE